jgi:ubiquinone/menaquinone biosynthesis C-methylase UbiE
VGIVSDGEVISFYEDRYSESDRLTKGHGRLEFLRTQDIVGRRLVKDGLSIADIGGGPGVYAAWLASLGHHVHLIDPVARHIEETRALHTTSGSIRAEVGDARALELDDQSVDAVLLLGPLYHLPEPADRTKALQESMRVLRPGGLIFAAAISRFASLHDGLVRGWLSDPEFATIAFTDLETGRHENLTHHPNWFTNAYFHHVDELRAELVAAGAADVSVHGVEGLAGWLPDVEERIADPDERRIVLEALHRTGTEPSLLGVSAHLLACATKPA